MCNCSTSDLATKGDGVVPFSLCCTRMQFAIFFRALVHFRATENCSWLPAACCTFCWIWLQTPNTNLCIHLDSTRSALCRRRAIKFVWAYVSGKKQRTKKCKWWGKVSAWVKGRPGVKSDSPILHTHKPASARGSGVYLLEAAHEVVANWRSGQVGCAGAPANIEKVVRAEHGVVFLSVPCGGQNPVHWYGHLETEHRERTRYTQKAFDTALWFPFSSSSSSSSLWDFPIYFLIPIFMSVLVVFFLVCSLLFCPLGLVEKAASLYNSNILVSKLVDCQHHSVTVLVLLLLQSKTKIL